MTTVRTAVVALGTLFASVAGCGGSEDHAINERFTVYLWVEDHPDLPLRAVVDGCALWRPAGVICGVTTEKAEAHVQVIFNADPCGKDDKDGDLTLAWASGDRIIHVRGACIGHDEKGRVDASQIETVIGHEVGHQLGIWDHVPTECADKHVVDSEGGDVCGIALMNPYYDSSVHFVTALDDLAFRHRDERRTVAPSVDVEASPAGPICSFKRR